LRFLAILEKCSFDRRLTFLKISQGTPRNGLQEIARQPVASGAKVKTLGWTLS